MTNPSEGGTGSGSGTSSALHDLVRRAVKVERDELMALLLSAAFFFSVLCSYYLLRPIRDEMGIALGRDRLQDFLVVVLFVMLAAVPAFGWVVANVARQRIVLVVYLFLIANLLVFRTLLAGQGNTPPAWLAGTFFVWINVYALFVVSLFWSFMSDLWTSDQSKRLYGFISVGGTAGAIAGPLLLNLLLPMVGLANLLLVSAALLGLALVVSRMLARLVGAGKAATAASTAAAAANDGGGLFDGALNVWRSPYLLRIALFVLAANLIGMYFYLKQNEIVGAALTNRDERLLFFSRIDLATNVLTILAQLFAVSRLIERIGVGTTAAIPPVLCGVGIVLLALFPAMAMIAAVVIVQRAAAYGFSNPSMRMLYTVVDPRDKYRSQNFNDTFVYRGGEAATGYVLSALGKAGAALPAVFALAVVGGWFWLAFDLGRRQEERAAAQKRMG
jgi:ATP:ADP antiporter, AAA family